MDQRTIIVRQQKAAFDVVEHIGQSDVIIRGKWRPVIGFRADIWRITVKQCIRAVVSMDQVFEVKFSMITFRSLSCTAEKDAEMLLAIFGAVAKVFRSEPNEILIRYRLRAARWMSVIPRICSCAA